MYISAESTSKEIIVTIQGAAEKTYILQRAFYGENRTWLTYTESGYVDLSTYPEQTAKPLDSGVFVDCYDIKDGLYEYRCYQSDLEEITDKDYSFSKWVKYGTPDAIGYTFNNYHSPEGSWGTIMTPDDFRYTYLWGADLKATNGTYFTDEQIQFFIDEATCYMERVLNISIVKKTYLSQLSTEGKTQGVDYDDEEALYDFSRRKIQRYGMIQTRHRPILNITRCELINRGDTSNMDLLSSCIPDKKKGIIKFLRRPYIANETKRNIDGSLGRYGEETFQTHLFYAIDYSAGYEKSDNVPSDLRQIIGKVCAISLLNIIGDGLMTGFSSSSLSMDGISESFSSTMSATSAMFGSRIMEYKKDIEEYLKNNKYRFNNMPIGCL